MKNMEAVIRKVFFYGALVVAALGVCQKIANTFGYTLWKYMPEITRLIEIAAVALLFSIAMQLHEIRLLLSSKPPESSK